MPFFPNTDLNVVVIGKLDEHLRPGSARRGRDRDQQLLPFRAHMPNGAHELLVPELQTASSQRNNEANYRTGAVLGNGEVAGTSCGTRIRGVVHSRTRPLRMNTCGASSQCAPLAKKRSTSRCSITFPPSHHSRSWMTSSRGACKPSNPAAAYAKCVNEVSQLSTSAGSSGILPHPPGCRQRINGRVSPSLVACHWISARQAESHHSHWICCSTPPRCRSCAECNAWRIPTGHCL